MYLRLSIPQNSLTPASTNPLSVHATSRRSGCGCVRPCRSTPDDYRSLPIIVLLPKWNKKCRKKYGKASVSFSPSKKNRETQAADAYVCRACISTGQEKRRDWSVCTYIYYVVNLTAPARSHHYCATFLSLCVASSIQTYTHTQTHSYKMR